VAGRDGIVYETEDALESGFYRFLPKDPARLAKGGTLQMLAVKGQSSYDTSGGQAVGAALPVEWVTIDEPDPATVDEKSRCFAQGFAKGGARFKRLEGIHRGEDDSIYFTSTSGGNAGLGQLWQYAPSEAGGSLTLRYEASDATRLESPDNLCVSPSGAILFCEDDAVADKDRHPLAGDLVDVNRLVGLTPSGSTFDFALNIHNASEFAGACFSPDGEVLFVNIQGRAIAGSGLTCAITGPWERGPL
jgi:uncharacterized protein